MALCIMSKCRGGGIFRIGTFRHSQECRNVGMGMKNEVENEVENESENEDEER